MKVRAEAVQRLLDDETPLVERAVTAELEAWGSRALGWLRSLSQSGDPCLAARARFYLERLAGPEPVRSFVDFVRSLQYELETGLFLINRTVHPSLDVEVVRRVLDAMGQRCADLMMPPQSPRRQCMVINRVLFHEMGFRGDTETFDDPHNSLLFPVLRRRRGVPLTLCAVYLLVARRCHLNLEPVGMPGRFLVGCFEEAEPFFIDPFERGVFRSPDELYAILHSNHIAPQPSYLAPVSVGEMLCRCCRNLVRQFTVRNHPARARLFAGFVREFEQTQRGTQPP